MKNIYKYALVSLLLILNLEAQTSENKTIEQKPFYQGKVVSVKQAQAYTFIEVKEKTNKSFWIATSNADVKEGDFVRFQKEIVVKNFKSKALDKVFKELLFASNLQYRVKE
ncbi:MAG: hypothetical protein L3J10_01440 [Sulfurimonas sp.]|nr:hypothetical protein [Sulfurimonas sp.]